MMACCSIRLFGVNILMHTFYQILTLFKACSLTVFGKMMRISRVNRVIDLKLIECFSLLLISFFNIFNLRLIVG